MKKCVLLSIVFLLLAAESFAFPPTRAPERQIYLGKNHVNMLWFILDYGTNEDGTHFSVARKYYTNREIWQETVELLMSNFGHSAELAGSLHFTEFEFEYTEDGRQFATTSLRHFDMLGNEIHGTVWDNSSPDRMKTFSPIVPAHASGVAIARILRR